MQLWWEKSTSKVYLLLIFGSSFALFLHYKIEDFILTDDIKTIVLALLATSFLAVIIQLVEVYSLHRKYKFFEGAYDAFGYQANAKEDVSKPEYNTLKTGKQGCATIKYLGDRAFLIRHSECGTENKWEGNLNIVSENMGDIGWKYSSPESLKDSTGYKKAILFSQDGKFTIYMFSDDNQRFGREVLIKNRDKK